jgi:hypothetical protein
VRTAVPGIGSDARERMTAAAGSKFTRHSADEPRATKKRGAVVLIERFLDTNARAIRRPGDFDSRPTNRDYRAPVDEFRNAMSFLQAPDDYRSATGHEIALASFETRRE